MEYKEIITLSSILPPIPPLPPRATPASARTRVWGREPARRYLRGHVAPAARGDRYAVVAAGTRPGAAQKRPAPARGGAGSGPLQPEMAGEDRSSQSNHRQLVLVPEVPVAPATRRAAQVGAGLNIAGGADGEADWAMVSTLDANACMLGGV